MSLHYKVVETSDVSDDELGRILNEWVGQGWSFEGFHFAMRDSSKRPSMAFVTFTRPVGADDSAGDAAGPR